LAAIDKQARINNRIPPSPQHMIAKCDNQHRIAL